MGAAVADGGGDGAARAPESRAPPDIETGRIVLAREGPIRLGRLTIEPALLRVANEDGREEIAQPRVMQVLVALARADGHIVSRDELNQSCWDGVVVGEGSINRVIVLLRRLTENIGQGEIKLETVTKVGYRLVPRSPPGRNAPTAATAAQAQSIVDERPPRDVAAQVPRDPGQIAVHGERRYIYAMVTDLQGFTELAHRLPPEMVANLLNAYLDRLSQTVLEHGGAIDKIVGDAMAAFWGAPIARPDDGQRAASAAIAAWRVGEAFRTTPIEDYPPLGRTRVGLHRGNAIIGNFGAEGRTAYTALGDVMNTAVGLERANMALNTIILVSREAIGPSMSRSFRAMGRISLRGRSTPHEVFELALDFPPEACERLNAVYARFDAGEVAALGEIRALTAAFPQDVALHGLHNRLKAVGPGGAFRLS